MRKFPLLVTALLPLLGVAIACDKRDAQGPPAASGGSAAATLAAVPPGFVLDKAPDGAKDVAAVRAAGVEEGSEVIVRGVVGGSVQPFVSGRAVVQIIDPSVPTCDRMPGQEACKTPWDACCNKEDITAKGATIQVVDPAGNPLKGTLQGVGGIKPLSEVVVRGKARTEGGKTLVVDATELYVKP